MGKERWKAEKDCCSKEERWQVRFAMHLKGDRKDYSREIGEKTSEAKVKGQVVGLEVAREGGESLESD